MKLRNKFLSLMGAFSLTFGLVGANQSNCFAMNSEKIKAVLCGEAGVGKTCVYKVLKGEDFVENSNPTISGALTSLSFNSDGVEYTYDIWDTAGQEKYRTLIPMYYRNAEVFLIVVDLSQSEKEIQEDIQYWCKYIKKDTPVGAPYAKLCVLFNKYDLVIEGEADCDTKNLTNFVKQQGDNICCFLVSAKTGENIGVLKDWLGGIAPELVQEKTLVKQINSVPIGGKSEKKGCC